MPFAKISHVVAGGRKDRSDAFANARRASGADVCNPNFLLRTGWVARRIRNFVGLVFVSSTHEGNRVPGGRENKVRQLLPLVTVVTRQLPRGKAGSLRDPDVAFAFGVKGPGDLVAAFGDGKLRRKWRAHDLFEGERLRRCAL